MRCWAACTGNDSGGSNSRGPSPGDRKGPPPPFTCTGCSPTVNFSWKISVCKSESSEMTVPRLARTPRSVICLPPGAEIAASGFQLAPNSLADKEISGLTGVAMFGALSHSEIRAWFGGKYAGKDTSRFLVPWESPGVVPSMGAGEV